MRNGRKPIKMQKLQKYKALGIIYKDKKKGRLATDVKLMGSTVDEITACK